MAGVVQEVNILITQVEIGSKHVYYEDDNSG